MSNKTILREEKAFNGNLLRLEYDKFDLGAKYKIRYQRPNERGFRFDTAWQTQGEANSYFNQLKSGGRSKVDEDYLDCLLMGNVMD